VGTDKDMGSTRPDMDWPTTHPDDRYPQNMPGRYPSMYPGKGTFTYYVNFRGIGGLRFYDRPNKGNFSL